MSRVLPGSVTATEAVRRAIRRGRESLRSLARRCSIDEKTVDEWKKRCSLADLLTGSKEPWV